MSRLQRRSRPGRPLADLNPVAPEGEDVAVLHHGDTLRRDAQAHSQFGMLFQVAGSPWMGTKFRGPEDVPAAILLSSWLA